MADPPVPFTDGELAAARMRIATRKASVAFRRFFYEWRAAGRRIEEGRRIDRSRREVRMAAAEACVLRMERPSAAQRRERSEPPNAVDLPYFPEGTEP